MHRKDDLLHALQAYAESDFYPFHMPGHKRNTALLPDALPYPLDITEIDGFDNLHAPEGILKELNNRLAALYKSPASFALVNGSTVGILAGMRAAAAPESTVLVARNVHRSVCNALELLRLKPVWLSPKVDSETGIAGGIAESDVRRALKEHPEVRLVVLTSPTYDGVISDVASIVKAAHEKKVPVLLDEAHGAHLQFCGLSAFSGVSNKADIVIQSLHKTLPALTQCAVAHIGGELISPAEFARQVSVFETSSPSYVLLASIAACVRLLETRGEELFAAYNARLERFSESCNQLKVLSVPGKGNCPANFPDQTAFDPGKLPILTANSDIDGAALAERLRKEFHIEPEMTAISYTLLMTSVCDTDEGFLRLETALREIDSKLSKSEPPLCFSPLPLPRQVLTPAEATARPKTALPFEKALGKTAAEAVWCYPPGTPLIMPGEEITKDLSDAVQAAKAHGLSVQSASGSLPLLQVCN